MSTTTKPEEFGRIDADGTVYVRTAEGERVVGSWQAGSPEEGLAHYARRYEDISIEVELLASRLNAGTLDPSEALSAARRHSDSLADVSAVGDLDALSNRLDEVKQKAEQAVQAVEAEKRAARAEAIARKEALVDEAEKLASESTQWKVAGERLRAIGEEWKTVAGVPRKLDLHLWKRFTAARSAFGRRRGTHFSALDAGRKEAVVEKEKIISTVAGLTESNDWKTTSATLRDLMNTWKQLPRASRDAEERLWKEFRGHLDTFYGRRDAANAERDAGMLENQKKKEELLSLAESLNVETDAKKAQSQLREIQRKWDGIGHVPREAVAKLDKRLKAVEDHVRRAVDEAWRAASAGNNPLLAQMREHVARAEKAFAIAEESGDSVRIENAKQALEGKKQLLEMAEKTAGV